MRREDGVTWLTPAEWIPWLMRTHPGRLLDPAAAPATPAIDTRAEARQWRAGQAQGLLARTSPLRAERTRR